MITSETPPKLAEIIRDTWPNLFYFKKVNNNDSIGINTTAEGGGSMSLMTGLNGIALSLWVGLDYFFFPLLILQLVAGLLAQHLSQAGTPTDSQVVTWRVLIFLQRLCQRLLMLWVILFFYFGVLSLRGTSSVGSNLGDSGILWRSTELSPSLGLCLGNLRLLVS